MQKSSIPPFSFASFFNYSIQYVRLKHIHTAAMKKE